jgi:hypothetical protein
MMRTWEEKIKFTFGSNTELEDDGYEVNVPGIPDNDETNVEDGFHTMQKYTPWFLSYFPFKPN